MTPSSRPSILAGFTSWRLGAVSLLSTSSGLPLGLVVTALPAWLAAANVDIKTIGLVTLAQLPYGFKFVWSPLMDRLRPPFMGFRRGWIFLCQLVLAAGTAVLGALAVKMPVCDCAAVLAGTTSCAALPAPSPGLVGLVAGMSLLISFASASQDIVYDAYAVEVLQKHEHGAAVGARSFMYRAGMWFSGTIAITLAPLWGWEWTLVAQGAIYFALLPVTVFAPEPTLEHAPPASLRDAVWQPFVTFLGRPRALEITAFVLLYRLADSIAGALVSPFLIQKAFSSYDVGVVRGLVGVWGTLLGTMLGGILAGRIGVGRALWICGVLQIVSNVGYAVVANLDPAFGSFNLPWAHELVVNCVTKTTPASVNVPLQAAILIETTTGGMGWGAFGVLLLRLTDKRFSATQYALFSSLVGLARTFVGPPAGIMADALGWRDFFLVTMAFGIPGMLMLKRFVPWGQEPKEVTGEALEPLPPGPPWPRPTLLWTSAVVGLAGGVASLLLSASMVLIKHRASVLAQALAVSRILQPVTWTDAMDLVNAVVVAATAGLAVAAYMAARGRR